MSLVGGFGVGMDNRFSPISASRSVSPIGSNRYGMGLNLEPGWSSSYGGNSNFGNSLGYALMLSPTYNGNFNRCTNPIGYNAAGNGRSTSLVNSPTRNVWGSSGINNGMNPGSTGAYLSSPNGGFGISGSTLGLGSFSTPGRGTLSGFTSPSNYRNGGNSFGLEGAGYGRINGTGATPASFPISAVGYEGSYGDFYHNGSVHGDATWRSTTPDS